MSFLHPLLLELVAEPLPPDGQVQRWCLRSPSPGWFRPAVAPSTWCAAGATVGTLEILGRRHLLVTPRGVVGFAGELVSDGPPRASSLAARAVSFRDPIATLSSDPALAGVTAPGAAAAAADPAGGLGGLVFRAPTSGRFYCRSAPDKPPFVAEGTQLVQGATICLLEVMKTFNRVTYGGAGLPDTARVTRVLVAEGADVNAGDPLLALE
jgi:acetyl-CoA carboxylase biotin carboxyl carrier protein